MELPAPALFEAALLVHVISLIVLDVTDWCLRRSKHLFRQQSTLSVDNCGESVLHLPFECLPTFLYVITAIRTCVTLRGKQKRRYSQCNSKRLRSHSPNSKVWGPLLTCGSELGAHAGGWAGRASELGGRPARELGARGLGWEALRAEPLQGLDA